MTITSTAPPPAARPARPQGGPPLLAPALAYGALMVTAVVLSARAPHLSAPVVTVAAYDSSHRAVLEVAGCLGFAASAPLAIWTATAYRRLQTLGVTAPGAVIALAGGLLAAASLGLSGLITWTSSQPGTAADPAAARVLADLSFATGAAGFVVPLALLLAGVAVPSLILGLVPRPLAWAGLGIAAIGVVPTFALLTPALDATLPAGRFGGLLWLIAASIALPRTRRAARTRAQGASPAPAGRPHRPRRGTVLPRRHLRLAPAVPARHRHDHRHRRPVRPRACLLPDSAPARAQLRAGRGSAAVRGKQTEVRATNSAASRPPGHLRVSRRATMLGMRYRRAVEKLRILAEACESVKDWPPENPFLLEAYAFGDVLRGADPLECVEVVLVLNLPPKDVVWGSSPHGTVWLADALRLSKGGFCYWWRSHLDPVWNHHVQEPVRFWSHDGPDEDVLRALAERRFAALPRQAPSPAARRDQVAGELDAALSHLREVHAAYWDDGWRRQHRGLGRYPEHELWEAVDGYLELRDAAESGPEATAE